MVKCFITTRMNKNIFNKKAGWVALVFLLLTFPSLAQISHQKGQAIFIYNFAKNIKWPSNPPSYNIGIIGSKEFYNELNTILKDKQIDGKHINIKLISSSSQIKDCQIVYLPLSRSSDLESTIETIGSREILTITENDLSEQGAAISFLMINDKLRFKINKDAITKNGLQVGSTLLSLAMK